LSVGSLANGVALGEALPRWVAVDCGFIGQSGLSQRSTLNQDDFPNPRAGGRAMFRGGGGRSLPRIDDPIQLLIAVAIVALLMWLIYRFLTR
jgi:hypothetical protein